MVTGITGNNLEQFRVEAKRILESSQSVKQGVPEAAAKAGRLPPGADRVTLGERPDPPVGYDPALRDAGLEGKYMMLQRLVVSMLQEQGIAFQVATGAGEIDISSLTADEATALIAEDGYFGVTRTASRIFDLAVGIAGNDTSRIDSIRSGIETGFAEAERVFGGTLPEISYKTRDAVMALLDQWYEGGAGRADTSGTESAVPE